MPDGLEGRRVLVTRAMHQSQILVDQIQKWKGEAVIVPLMRYQQCPLSAEDREHWIGDVSQADLIILTSRNSLDFLVQSIGGPEPLKDARLAAIGVQTAAGLSGYGLKAGYMPKKFNVQTLMDDLRSGRLHAKRIVIPHGSLTDMAWIRELRTSGFAVSDRVLYETVPDFSERIRLEKTVRPGFLDAVTFVSPSAVRFFAEMLDDAVWRGTLRRCTVAVIGTSTARQLEEFGFSPDVVPARFTASDMIDALANYYNKRKSC